MDRAWQRLEVGGTIVGFDAVKVVDVVVWRDGHVIGELPEGAVKQSAAESVRESHVALVVGISEARSKTAVSVGE